MDTKNLIDEKKLEAEIFLLITEKDIYKRKTATLRTQISRLRSLQKSIKELKK